MSTRRSGNSVWVDVDWFLTHQSGRNLSLAVINFGSKLLPLLFLIIIGESIALMQLSVLIQLGLWYISSTFSDTTAFESKYMDQCLGGISPIQVLSLFYAAMIEAPTHPLPINKNFVFDEKAQPYVCQRWQRPFFIIVNRHGWMAVSKYHMYLWRYWSYCNKKLRFRNITSSSLKRDVVLHLNAVWRGVRADRKLLMVNEGKEDGWRAVSQDQLYLRRYWSYGNRKCRFWKITSSSWKMQCSVTPECRLAWSYSWRNEDLKIADCEWTHGRCHSGVGDDGCCFCYCCWCFVLQLMRCVAT